MYHGWGGLSVDVNNAPKGTDFTPLLEGLENDHCQVLHWGYVVKGGKNGPLGSSLHLGKSNQHLFVNKYLNISNING